MRAHAHQSQECLWVHAFWRQQHTCVVGRENWKSAVSERLHRQHPSTRRFQLFIEKTKPLCEAIKSSRKIIHSKNIDGRDCTRISPIQGKETHHENVSTYPRLQSISMAMTTPLPSGIPGDSRICQIRTAYPSIGDSTGEGTIPFRTVGAS